VWLWRWRHNPLRRRSDVAEAWLIVGVWCLVVVGGALAGTAVAHAVERNLDGRRAERHTVSAVLTEDAGPVTASGGERVRARVHWTAADGSTRTGVAFVQHGSRAGSATRVWLDREGELVPEPVTADEAELEGAVLGTATALCVAAVAWSCGRLAHGRLDRRRMAGWDREWALVGPRWGGHTTG
jgi:hypothetical protein